MRCSKCGRDNREGGKFCAHCGAPIIAQCPHCGAPNEPAERFCGECGFSLSSIPASSTSSIRTISGQVPADELTDGERKTVTALFADIKGSMDLMEDLDPDEARAIVDPALKLMIEAVRHYGGYVVQSTGDGIFALFGAPVAHEDHPQRALYAALRVQEEMRRYSGKLRQVGNPPIEARVGVNTGEVVVRSIATGENHPEYTSIGHSTGLAARMQALAPTGSIAVTDGTRKLCEGYFTFRTLGPTRVKGVSEPVEVFEVTSLGPLRTRLQVAAKRGLTRFVGREREMEALRHAAELARTRHGQLVAAMGEPGAGKSRLFHEFKLISQTQWMTLEAFSLSHGKATAYLPLLELLREYFRIITTDDSRIRREKVAGKVLMLDRSLEETLPYLFALLGLSEGDDQVTQMDTQVRRRRTHEAIKRILLRESLNQPLMVIVEDLHWIDGETQALLNLLVDTIANARILLLVNYRPEYHHEWGNRTYYNQLRLDPLGRESAEEMLNVLLGTLPAASSSTPLPDQGEIGERDNARRVRVSDDLGPLKRLIIERTEGNPFFMEEIVQALLDEGALVRDGEVKLTKPLGELKLPLTVQAMLSARIDRLPPADKELLQTLAVIGKELPLELIQRVTVKREEQLEPMLTSLQLGEFIYEQPSFAGSEYTFKHALTQEVSYNSLLAERRKILHERAGQGLEAMFSGRLDEHLSELAHHYSRGGNAAKALEYLHLAGQQALQRSANAEAIIQLSAAIDLLHSLPETIERAKQELSLQILLGVALLISKGWGAPEVEGAYERARELCRQIGDAPELPPVLWGLFQIAGNRPDYPRQAQMAAELFALAQQREDPALLLVAHFAVGFNFFWLGEFTSARAHAEQGLALYDSHQHRSLALLYGQDLGVSCQAAASWASCLQGYPDEALRRGQQALTLARDLAHSFSSIMALTVLAVVHEFRREGKATQDCAEAMIALGTEQGIAFFLSWGTILRGWALAEQGQKQEGLEHMRQGLTACRATGAKVGESRWFALQAEIYAELGQVEEALNLLADAFTHVNQTGERFYEAELYRLKGEITLKQSGRASPESIVKEAEACFRHSIAIARQQRAKSWELRATISLARLLAKQGHRNEAHTMLAEIYNWFTEGFDTADLKEAKALLDELAI